jgi:protein TonB
VKPVANPNAAPTVAPSTIEPEKPFDFEPVETLPVGVIGDPGSVNVALAPPPVVVAPPPPQPVQVGGTIRRPVKVSGSDPVYSPFARAAGLQGIVIIEATIGADGRMMNARVLRSVHQLLDQAALDAVRTWEYTPTMLNGVPVPVIMTVTVTFMLSR